MAILLFEVLRRPSTTFAHATSSWTLGIVLAIIIVGFGFCTLGHAFVQPVCDTIQTCLYRFMTHNVEAWVWLPQNGATSDFKPAWGDALGILTILSGFAVCVGFWWAVLRC
ncbi:hypothetical protein B0T25DRAFT_128607 [Lasiosphaeria hispida]|uniref:Uncharacterized protein n=1 Tax=Lasiosphaeria hispida TaxID=260671 RepID=A0AAJ0HSC0_9PEZI|nr:hypothetical protein B0T25DRAFT_128607 [Lasiosphaeria hispida]